MAVIDRVLAVEQTIKATERPSMAGMTINSIQCLRAIAAIIVVIFHAHISFMPANSPSYSAGESYVFGMGKVGVHIFFAISGYIMYISSFYSKSKFELRRFFLRRVIRVYPIYWIFVPIYLAVALLVGTYPDLRPSQYVGMLILLPDSSSLVIGPAWTLSYEVYFYLAFGFIMQLGAVRGLLALTGFFFCSIVAGVLLRPSDPILAVVTNGLLLEFVMGVWIGHFSVRYALSRKVGWVMLVSAIVGYTAGLLWGYDRLPSAIMWGIPSAMLIAGAVILEQRSVLGVSHPIHRLSWLGDSSYSLYLCHILIITLMIYVLKMLNISSSILAITAFVSIISIAFAIVFHKSVEIPVLSFLNRQFLLKKN